MSVTHSLLECEVRIYNVKKGKRKHLNWWGGGFSRSFMIMCCQYLSFVSCEIKPPMAALDLGHPGNPATTTTAWTARAPVYVALGHVTVPLLDVEAKTARVTRLKFPTAQGRKDTRQIADMYIWFRMLLCICKE